ncbi:MAG: hypothetical protein ACRYFU_11685 [Janthinobacterium lividum]
MPERADDRQGDDMTAHLWDTGLTLAFDSSVGEYFAPDIEAYCDILLGRIMPIFNEADSVYREASAAYKARFSEIPNLPIEIEEQAHEHASITAMQFAEMRDVFIAVGVSGLFHIFEKQVYRHLNRDFERHGIESICHWDHAKHVIDRFTHRYEDHEIVECAALVSALKNTDLQELESLANSVKHGTNGRSFRALIKSDSPVVAGPRDGDDISPQTILKVDLTITSQDVLRYKAAIIAFWSVEGEFWVPYESVVEAKNPNKAKKPGAGS